MIDKHMYPKNFFFAVTRDGVDGRRSMLLEGGHRRRRSSLDIKEVRRSSLVESGKAKQESRAVDEGKEMLPEERPDVDMEGEPTKSKDVSAPSAEHDDRTEAASGRPDVDMDDLTGAMSSLKFVPRSIRFGRGGRAGFAKS